MTKYMDYMISNHPIRVYNPMVDSSKLKIKSLTIVNSGHLPARTLQRIDANFKSWAFVMITGGGGFYQVNGGERQAVEAGSWFCLYPGAIFNYGPHKDGYWDEYYFTVDGVRVDEWLENWLTDPGLLKHADIDEAFIHKMELMFMLIDSGVPSNLDRASMMLESFLYELVAQSDKSEAGNRGSQVLKVIDDISHSLHLSQEPEDMAARHHISVSTLRRIIHEYTGFPLNEFLHRLKAAEAKNILLNSELTVKEVGEALGYKDTFYFSRVFKRITGLSPRNYRGRVGQ
ncbi:helix-turn-helix domain-containing protein [Paenibacillus macquariensis]|uniref:Transcriptional regulator, AraC family n=1 Tax=Paenibacillus macquariensis TaxID=948756 RepID=A0ABY1JYF2_9BACL|nr:AraC family transcriptional regulator [Paenibacillus macquariensis]MEC0089216.1 AraC family transcriptional regulator [Paenibacillus macquariensis]OAB33368.1 transcriptional regulator [Paenibacillus macquariensis subsp. macquariensis]SIQ96247.1 transcriptional regulator, AraC family [Paenibacillus macquariensis]